MDPTTTAHFASESLGICIAIGKRIKCYIDNYRSALDDLDAMDLTVSLAWQTAKEFDKALGRLSDEEQKQVEKVFDRLSRLFGDIQVVLCRYDGQTLGTWAKFHWTVRGKSAALGVKVKIDQWLGQVYPLVLTCLVRVGVVEELGYQTKILKTVDNGVSELQKSLEKWAGLEKGVVMRAVQEAMKAEQDSGHKIVQIHTAWRPIVVDLSRPLETTKPQLQIDQSSMFAENYSLATNEMTSLAEFPASILLEHRRFGVETCNAVRDSSDLVAHILQDADPGFFNVPQCFGFYKDTETSRYSLIMSGQFSVPDVGVVKATQFTLEDAIVLFQESMQNGSGNNTAFLTTPQIAIINCLNDLQARAQLAIQLIRALSYIHAVDWVHKSFRSSNVVLCLDIDTSTYVVPLIVGFHRARRATDGSDRRESTVWDGLVYRHPDRWMESGNPPFEHTHDIYSLGVVLLELGLGKLARLVLPDPAKLESIVATHSVVSNGNVASEKTNLTTIRRSIVIESFLEEVKGLRRRHGPTYANVVQKCLDLGRDAKSAPGDLLLDLHTEMSSATY